MAAAFDTLLTILWVLIGVAVVFILAYQIFGEEEKSVV